MDNKCIRVIINGLRFLGTSFYNRVLAVDTTTIIRKASKAKIVIGKEFRSRRNVEINARGKSLICIGNHVFIDPNFGLLDGLRLSVLGSWRRNIKPHVFAFFVESVGYILL